MGVTTLGQQLRVVLRTDQRSAIVGLAQGEAVTEGGDDLGDAAGVLEVHEGGEHAVLQEVAVGVDERDGLNL